MGRKDVAGEALGRLREFGLRYPGAHTKSPWPGHLDLAVRDKTFAYMSVPGEPFKLSCKLPRSAELALSLPFSEPTGYGLGKSGWVTATFPDGGPVPVELLEQWIDESYRAQAPKRLSAGPAPLAAVEVSATPARSAARTGETGAHSGQPKSGSTAAKPASQRRKAASPKAPARKAARAKTNVETKQSVAVGARRAGSAGKRTRVAAGASSGSSARGRAAKKTGKGRASTRG